MATYGYVAALLARDGEHRALANSRHDLRYFLPILQLPPVSTTPTTPSIQLWLLKQCTKLAQDLAGDGVCLDLSGAEMPEQVPFGNTGKPKWLYVHDLAQHVGLKMMPVIRISDSILTRSTAGEVAGSNGAVIRLTRAECLSLATGDGLFAEKLQAVPSDSGVDPRHIRLIMDLEDVGDDDINILSEYCLNAISKVAGIPWKSVSLCATSAPFDTSKLGFGWTRFVRREYELWNIVRRTADVRVHYGDYGGFAAQPPNSTGFPRHPTLRYTVGTDLLIGRHEQQQGEKFDGFRFLCQFLINNGSAEPPEFSWGDERIHEIAAGRQKSGGGGGPGWRAISLSHHFSRVVSDLPEDLR